MSWDCPTAAQACLAASSFGFVVRSSVARPAATAPLETITHSLPARTSAPTPRARRAICLGLRPTPLSVARMPEPNLRTMRWERLAMGGGTVVFEAWATSRNREDFRHTGVRKWGEWLWAVTVLGPFEWGR